jgi:hypothetical protein
MIDVNKERGIFCAISFSPHGQILFAQKKKHALHFMHTVLGKWNWKKRIAQWELKTCKLREWEFCCS